MNSMEHSSIKCAPADIILTQAVNLSKGFFPDSEQLKLRDESPKNLFFKELIEVQPRIIELARESQNKTDLEHLRKKMQKEYHTFKEKDWVLLDMPETYLNLDSRSDKLSSHYRGPYLIDKVDGNSVTLKNMLENVEIKTVSTSHIQPFYYDKEKINPIQIQAHASDEFFIERILKHRGPTKNRKFIRSQFEARIRWAGYDSQWDTWEPFALLRDNATFHKYLIDQNLKYLLSKEARNELVLTHK